MIDDLIVTCAPEWRITWSKERPIFTAGTGPRRDWRTYQQALSSSSSQPESQPNDGRTMVKKWSKTWSNMVQTIRQ